MNMCQSKGKSPITGNFIQPWLYANWSDERWEQEMTMLKELGVEFFIMGDVVVKNDAGKWQKFYKSDLPQFQDAEFVVEGLENLFEKCNQFGMKIFIGTGLNSEWWKKDFTKEEDKEWLIEFCKDGCDISQELYDKFHTKYPETFYGWYWVHEMWNHAAFNDDGTRKQYADNLAEGFNIMLEKWTDIDPTLPMTFSPFANTKGHATLENHCKFWDYFCKKVNFRKGDILCPQDGVGAGGQNLIELEDWTKGYYDGAINSGHGMKFWSNCENFVQPPETLWHDSEVDRWGSAPIDRYIKQIEIVSKYAERVFSFTYSHYYSPFNSPEGYHNAYMEYLETGKLDDTKPTLPNEFVSFIDESGYLIIHWDGLYDRVGISRVNVYKNGDFYDFRIARRSDGRKIKSSYPTTYYDKHFDNIDNTVYEFEYVDCAGNISDKIKITVNEKGKII